MASDGITNRALKGTCRICQRSRCTSKHVKPVGEVRHGFATGHIWECFDIDECHSTAEKKLLNPNINGVVKSRIETAIEDGNYKEYKYYS